MEQGDFLSFVSYGAGDRLTSLTQFLVLNGKLYMCSAHQRVDGASGQCQITVWPTSQEKGENLILIYQARADVSCRGTRRINQCDSLPSRPLSLSPSLDYKADCGAKEYFARVTLIAPPPARALYIMCPPPPLPSPPPPAGRRSLPCTRAVINFRPTRRPTEGTISSPFSMNRIRVHRPLRASSFRRLWLRVSWPIFESSRILAV